MIAGMRNAFPEAEVDGWQPLEEDMRNSDKDKHVLALAVRARADMLVTSNLKHFPLEACEPYSIEPIDPDEFLCQLLEGSEAGVKSVL
jgi:predicted nucleic acid-binding protein